MKIILGSASKFRKQRLEEFGYKFELRPAAIDEKAIRTQNLAELPLLIALAKNQKLQEEIKEPTILVTADTVIIFENQVREKPKDEDEAREFLRSYHRSPVEVVTGVAVTNTRTGRTLKGSESSKLFFHKIPEPLIHELVSHGAVLHAAGGFIAEMPAISKYIVHLEGNMDNVMGLPGKLTQKLIEELSYGE